MHLKQFVENKKLERWCYGMKKNQIKICIFISITLFLLFSTIALASSAEVNFDDEKFEKQNDFNQVIIFMGIEQEKDDNDKPTGRFIVLAKIVTYSNIEDVQFIIEDKALANKFKKSLNPYNAIKVSGHMVSSTQTETVATDDDDNWGEEDSMEKVSAPTKREFIITGAKGSTIDKELYTEANVAEAMAKIAQANKAENDFGGDDKDDWGESNLDDSDEDEAW